jgi:hypothetical protein
MGDQGQELARDALERVCSGSDASAAEGVYSRSFRDHVNGRDYVGHEGIRQSLALYQLAFETATYRSRSSTSSQRATRLSPAGSRRATTAVGRSRRGGS